MYTAIVTVPSVFLYESPSAENVSDELLSGWLVTVQNRQGNFLEITTDYGYTGWLECPAIRRLSSEEALNLKVSAKTPEDTERPAVLCRGITDLQKEDRIWRNGAHSAGAGSGKRRFGNVCRSGAGSGKRRFGNVCRSGKGRVHTHLRHCRR